MDTVMRRIMILTLIRRKKIFILIEPIEREEAMNLNLTQHLKRKIKKHAMNSIYRLNARSANCYSFSLYKKNKRTSWDGGWDYTNNLMDRSADYLYDIVSNKFIAI
jgi:hypothetical protein